MDSTGADSVGYDAPASVAHQWRQNMNVVPSEAVEIHMPRSVAHTPDKTAYPWHPCG